MGNREETLSRLLVWIMKDIMEIESKSLITGEFKDITTNDMHVIEAIGIGEPKKMTEIARTVVHYDRDAYKVHERFRKEELCKPKTKRRG